jgi:DNA uptake protein ComE-like DNA-binding protein
MWKDFFFFSRGEKNGILVLICLIMVTFIINRMIPFFVKTEPEDIATYKNEIEAFRASFKQKEQIMQERKLFYFDPNEADSLRFIELGIKPAVISRIMKYRNKGGVFRKPEDFLKIYGLNQRIYEELQPYINIKRAKKVEKPKEIKPQIVRNKENKVRNEKRQTIELNSADTTVLKSLKGIGSVYAGRIIKYRTILGGFYNTEQLKEVYGITDELFMSICADISVDTTSLKKIKLNRGDLTYRLKHPYLQKEQVKALLAYMKKNNSIDSVGTLERMNVFTKEELNRLRPYLCFKKNEE